MNAYLDEIRTKVLDNIPLVSHLNVVLESDESNSSIIARAPLENNRNHRHTAFAVSLNAVATLACWAMSYVLLRERGVDAEIVLQKSSIRHLCPVRGEIVAIAVKPEGAEVEAFFEHLERKKRARIKVRATIHDEGELAATFKGRYAVTMPARP